METNQKPENIERFVTTREAADRLRVHDETVRRWITRGGCPALSTGGSWRLSDATNPDQALLFEKEPNLPALRVLIVKRFTGLEVAVNEIEEFVVDATPFHSGYYKRVLREMELAAPPALVPVSPPATRKKGTFADPKLRVRFS